MTNATGIVCLRLRNLVKRLPMFRKFGRPKKPRIIGGRNPETITRAEKSDTKTNLTWMPSLLNTTVGSKDRLRTLVPTTTPSSEHCQQTESPKLQEQRSQPIAFCSVRCWCRKIFRCVRRYTFQSTQSVSLTGVMPRENFFGIGMIQESIPVRNIRLNDTRCVVSVLLLGLPTGPTDTRGERSLLDPPRIRCEETSR